jgi:flagellar motor switch protein FliN
MLEDLQTATPVGNAEHASDWPAAEAAGTIASTELTDSHAMAKAAIFQRLTSTGTEVNNDIDLILDIPVQLTVELGRTRIAIKNILQLAEGSVIELDALAGEPMDVLVNGCLIAQGEVVVVNDKFGVRLTDVTTQAERIRRLKR